MEPQREQISGTGAATIFDTDIVVRGRDLFADARALRGALWFSVMRHPEPNLLTRRSIRTVAICVDLSGYRNIGESSCSFSSITGSCTALCVLYCRGRANPESTSSDASKVSEETSSGVRVMRLARYFDGMWAVNLDIGRISFILPYNPNIRVRSNACERADVTSDAVSINELLQPDLFLPAVSVPHIEFVSNYE
ncbi:hypothetical protein QAD02_024394 [Eretmocerus hayati]|uniref:Uncharacterized protein n=1 Tax=Eretmocerus hayati TaxID=131215 RepID=A0ACC2PYC4_9HYME|nr:hypothetical protein QAD02_024394 [Eretmocerus hayati]